MTLVLRNQRASTSQQQATKYAQQAVEWVRQVRDDAGWQSFYETVNADSTGTHCMRSIPAATNLASYNSIQDGACGSTETILNEPTGFTRTIVVTRVGAGADNIRVDATVSWVEGTKNLDAQTTVVLRKWN